VFSLMDTFRAQLEAEPVLTSQGPLTITVSTGIAGFIDGSLDNLLNRADKALYDAKELGRNLVCIEGT
jgi:PleD family two-component response regulator